MDFLCRIGLMYISTELLGSCFGRLDHIFLRICEETFKYFNLNKTFVCVQICVKGGILLSHYVYMSFDKIRVHLVSDFTIILPTSQYIGGNKQVGGTT